MIASIEVEPGKLWIWIEDLAWIDDDDQEAVPTQSIKSSTFNVHTSFLFEEDQVVVYYPSEARASDASTKQSILPTHHYTIKGSQEVVVPHLDGTKCESKFSITGLIIQGSSSLELGDLV
jgi:hypothetical protein